jgi:arsenite-transporting ATPase
LALPQVTVTWIERLTAIRRQILEKRYTIQKIRRPLKTGEEKREIRLSYDETDDDILNRLLVLQENYGKLTAVLQGATCGIVLVFNPDILSLRESERLIEGLGDLKLPLRLLVQNKVTEENRTIADRVAGALQKASGHKGPARYIALNQDIALKGAGLYNISEDLRSDLEF